LIETARCAHARLELRESARGNLPFQHSIHFFRVLQRAASFRIVLSPAIDADKDIALALQRGESRIRRAGGQRPKISRQIRSKGLTPSSENFRLPLTAASKLGANWIPVRAVQKSAAEQRSQCWAKQAQSPFTAIPPTFSPITTSIKSNADCRQKKALRISSGALLYHAEDTLFNNNKVRIARADHALRIHEAIHVNRDPATVLEHKVRVPDQSEMIRPKSLDEELFRMPAETEHFGMTRSELFLVHRRRLIRTRHVRLARARTRTRFILVYVRSVALNFCLSAYVCTRLRFCLRFALLLCGTHLLPFRRGSSLCLFRLPLRLLWLLRCLAQRHKR